MSINRAKFDIYCAYTSVFTDVDHIDVSNIEFMYDEMIEKIKNVSNYNDKITINLDYSGELHSESEDVPAIKIIINDGVFYFHYNHGNILTGNYPYCKKIYYDVASYSFLVDNVQYTCNQYFEPIRTYFFKWDENKYKTTIDEHGLLSDSGKIIAEFPCDDTWNCKFKFAD